MGKAFDNAAGTLAMGTGLRDAEDAAEVMHLSTPAASGAVADFGAGFRCRFRRKRRSGRVWRRKSPFHSRARPLRARVPNRTADRRHAGVRWVRPPPEKVFEDAAPPPKDFAEDFERIVETAAEAAGAAAAWRGQRPRDQTGRRPPVFADRSGPRKPRPVP